MANNHFEGALTSLLKPQEKSRLLKILAEIRKGVEGPNRKKNISKLCEKGCLKHVITNLQQPHVDILNVTLSILGNCCMEQACARDAVKQYNLLSYLNHTLKHYKQDSIQGRIFRIIGNMCQHWDRLANTVVEKESELEIVAKIVTFLKSVAEADDQASDIKSKTSDATICMAIRALKELANSNTVVTLITDCGVLKAIGMILIKFAPEWQSNKQHGEILQAVLKLLYMYSKYNTKYDAIMELRNTDKGNAMDHFGKLVLLSPFIVVKIIVNLKKVCKLKSDLPVSDISQSLIERLQNPTYFPCGRADPMHRDYLKCLCLLIQQLLPLKAEILAAGVIPTLLLILEDYTEFTDISMKNTVLIIATLRNIFEDPSLIIMLKHGIINILSEKMNWVLGPDAVVDVSHKYKSGKFLHGYRKRSRYAEVQALYSCMDVKGFEDFESMKITFSQLRRKKQRSLSPSSDNSLSSGPSRYSPPSSPTLSLSDTEVHAEDFDSDSDDYSPVCSDAEDEASVSLTTIKEDEDPVDDEMDGQSSLTELMESKSNPAFYSRKLLAHEILKLIKLFINIRPVAMELNNGHLLTKLLMLLAPANNIICPSDTLKVIVTIVKTSEYLLGLMQTDFISATYKFVVWQHEFGCMTCSHLYKTGQAILIQFSKLVELGCGAGEIAHQLYRATLPVKEKLVTAIPFFINNKPTLRKLMIQCCGLKILIQLFREQSNLKPNSAYYGLCLMALKLGIKNPTTNIGTKLQPATQLPIDLENYKLETNCTKIVSFKLDDGSCVQADRDFLSQKSDYFNRLLSGKFKESCEKEIQLCKVLNKSLKCLLMLLQYDVRSTEAHQIDVELDVLLDVISLTDRYVMDDLCSCVTLSVQYFKFSPATIPVIYQWALESGTNILRVESIAYALVVNTSESERLTMFQNLLQLGYTDQISNDIDKLLRRFIL